MGWGDEGEVECCGRCTEGCLTVGVDDDLSSLDLVWQDVDGEGWFGRGVSAGHPAWRRRER